MLKYFGELLKQFEYNYFADKITGLEDKITGLEEKLEEKMQFMINLIIKLMPQRSAELSDDDRG